MEDLRLTKVLGGHWSLEENKVFEMALAVVEEQHPHRWEAVAAMIGGLKTSDDVHKHYNILLEDLQLIDSGLFDHQFAKQSLCRSWTSQDDNFPVQLNLDSSAASKAMIQCSQKQLDSNAIRSGPRGLRCSRATDQVNCKL